jgi:quercetin dioxygenase-like cupin family protein
MSKFVMGSEVPSESFDWGSAGMRCAPPGTGCETFVVMDVRLDPGFFHAFHKHPDQDEMIIIKKGVATQYLEQDARTLNVGDSIYIDKDVVHATYNDGDEPVELQVILAPPVTDGGYVAVDVSTEEPWASLR